VAKDLAVKLQILLGAFSLDLYQKMLIFWQITQSLISDGEGGAKELVYGTHMGFCNYTDANILLKMSMPR
jgi:hypothetical protein